MKKRTFLKLIGSATLLRILAGRLRASATYCRRRPSDAAWPSETAWKQLNDDVGGNLIRVDFPLSSSQDGSGKRRSQASAGGPQEPILYRGSAGPHPDFRLGRRLGYSTQCLRSRSQECPGHCCGSEFCP